MRNGFRPAPLPSFRRTIVMRFLIAVAALTASLAPALAAQNAPVLRGVVRDSLGRPMVGVEVSHKGGKTITDSTGMFRLSPVPLGRLPVRFIRDGIVIGSMTALVTADTTNGVFVDEPPEPVEPSMLYGTVVDSAGAPIRDATVEAVTVFKETRTDSLGRFAFRNLPNRRHILRIRRVGYAPSYAAADLVSGNSARIRVVVRQYAGQNLGLVVVRATRPPGHLRGFLQRAARPSGWGRIIMSEEIVTRNPLQTSDMLLAIPGVKVDYSVRGVGTVRGRGGCLMAVYINGFPAPQTGSIGIDDMVSTNDLTGIEVYNGFAGVPAELMMGGPNNCGTLALWTK
jgi:hypothetical protein